MASRTYTVQVNIAATGGRVVATQLGQIQQQARSASTAVSFFKRTIAGLGLGLGIRQLAEFADQVTNLRNRLGLLTTSTIETNRITRELFTIAKDTRSEFDGTAQVFTRLALSAKQLGETNDELLAITRSLNQAVILSGANAREASNGLIQLSQAIASNRLGGDELRSVLEQLPLVTDIIGQELVKLGLAVNGTRGEVRQLGFEGKITAKVIIDAFKAAREELEERFANTAPTIAQSLVFLTTSIVELVDQFNQFSNSSHIAAEAIIFLAKHLRELLNLLLLLGGAFAGVKFAAFAASIANLVRGFFAARAAMALFAAGAGPAVVGVTTLTGAFKALFLALGGIPALIGLIVTGLALLANANLNFFGGQNAGNKDALKEASDAMKDIGKFAPEVQSEVRALNNEISETAVLLDDQANSWIRNDELVESLQKRQENAVKKLIELQRTGGGEGPTKQAQEQADLLAKILRQLDREFAALQLNRKERERAVELARIEEQLRGKGFEGAKLDAALEVVDGLLARNQAQAAYREVLDSLLAPQEDLTEATDIYTRILAEAPQFAERYGRELIRLRIQALEPMTDAVSGLHRAQLEQQLEFTNDAAAAADAYRALTDPALKYAQTMRVLNEIIAEFPELQREATRAAIDARIALLETQTTAAAGIERGLLKIKQQVSDTGTLAETALTNAFNNAKEAMLDFFTTGKLSMTDFVNSLQRDLANLALSGLISNTLGAALGLGGKGSGAGGIASFISGIFGGGGSPASSSGPALSNDPTNFANGGAFTVGGMGGVDSQQVAFRATPGERVTVQTPEQQRNGTARAAKVNIYVTTPDAQSFARSQSQILARTQRQLDRAARRDG